MIPSVNTNPIRQPLSFRVYVTKHARQRWRERYHPDLTDAEVERGIITRVVSGLRYIHNIRSDNARQVMEKLANSTVSVNWRFVVGDMEFVTVAVGLWVRVITVIPAPYDGSSWREGRG